MIKGNQGDWKSYPVYSLHYFDEIRMTTDLFREFFSETLPTPVVDFLRQCLKEEDPFQLLRENFKEATFARACHEKFDGLRILQYLKYRQNKDTKSDEEHLQEFLFSFYPDECEEVMPEPAKFNFATSALNDLDLVRRFLMKKEEAYQSISEPSLPGQPLP